MDTYADKYTSKSTIKQVVVTVVATLGYFLSGLTMGFPSVILDPLVQSKAAINATVDQASWISGVAPLASPFGCLLGGPLVDVCGRRMGLLLLNIPNVAGWLLLALVPYPIFSLTPMVIGRLLTGFAAGLATTASATYTAEIATSRLRTVLVTFPPVMMGIGIFVIYLLADLFRDQWLVASVVGLLISIASIVLTPFLPESPLWLLQRGETARAESALMALRATSSSDDIKHEFVQMSESLATKTSKGSWKTTIETMKKPEAYKPLVIMNIFFLIQQASGVSVIIVYGVKFAEDAEIPNDAYTVALFIGIVRVIATFLTTWSCNRWGKRKPVIAMGVGTTLSLFCLVIYITLRHTFPTTFPVMTWIPAVCILVNILTSSIGFSTLLWSMLGEVFPTSVRGFCSGLSSCFGYMLNFLSVKLYPVVEPQLGNIQCFIFFGVSALIGTIYLAMFLPETHRKSLDEIENYFRGLKGPEKNSKVNESYVHQ